MLASALLLAATLPTQTVAVGVGGCVCLSDNDHVESNLKTAYVGHVRAQYDHRVVGGLYFGVTAAGEWVSRFGRQPGVALAGPVIVLRSSGDIRGSLRVAGGFAYAHDAKWATSPGPRNVHSFGWFLDTSAEIAVRATKALDVYLDLSILNFRSLKYRDDYPPGVNGFQYFTAVVPTMATVGVRFTL